jgi:hypothetical protein
VKPPAPKEQAKLLWFPQGWIERNRGQILSTVSGIHLRFA